MCSFDLKYIKMCLMAMLYSAPQAFNWIMEGSMAEIRNKVKGLATLLISADVRSPIIATSCICYYMHLLHSYPDQYADKERKKSYSFRSCIIDIWHRL